MSDLRLPTAYGRLEPPLPAFYSYAHKHGRDCRHLDELLDALAACRRERMLDEWDDRKLRAGQEWEDVIIERARCSRVFFLILTNRFIASDFCVGTELTIARALHAKRAAVIAPVLAEDADWDIAELRDLQIIMPFGKPVSGSKKAKAWTEVARAVRQMAKELAEGTYFSKVPITLPAVPSLLPFTIGRERETADFVKALHAAPRQRPFVAVITGENQGQSEFVESLLCDDGPIGTALGLTAANNVIAMQSSVWTRSREPIESLLNATLSGQLMIRVTSADRTGIATAFNAHPGLSIVNWDLSAAEWNECGKVRFQQFLDYWADWPDLIPSRPLIIFLTIRTEVPGLNVPGGICLPLSSVTPEAVQAWLATPEVSRRFIVDRVRQHLHEVFALRDRLPMEEFASRFHALLRRFQQP